MRLYADRIFPWVMDKVMGRGHVAAERALVLGGVEGDVLEIGFGTGLNFPHYPASTKSVTGVDPSPGMLSRARSRADASRLPITLMRNSAEELPFEESSFDAVVTTWTLCTIPDVGRALAEARRVLKPQGRLFFLEHGLAPTQRDRRLQELFAPLNRCVSLGCHLNRDITSLITDAGFQIVQLERYVMPSAPRLLAFAAHLFRGSATL